MDQPNAPLWGYYTVDLFDCPQFEMFTNNDDPRLIDIVQHKRFEPCSMKLWCRRARFATGIIDIGAHVGVYALSAAALRSDIQIYAFEPNPHAFARLRINKDRNQFTNIREMQTALAHEKGIVEFSWQLRDVPNIASGGTVGGFPERTDLERTVVRLAKLDDVAGARDLGTLGLIKIDVENAERATFMGMAKTLQTHRPDIILETFDPQNCDYINSLIKPLGYEVYRISEMTGALIKQEGLMPMDRGGSDFNQFLTVHSSGNSPFPFDPSGFK